MHFITPVRTVIANTDRLGEGRNRKNSLSKVLSLEKTINKNC